MTKRHVLSGRLVLAVVALVFLFLPFRAEADEPLMTDPAGDTGLLGLALDQSAVDIVSGDATTTPGGDLAVSLGVLDLDGWSEFEDAGEYTFTGVVTGNVRLSFSAARVPHGPEPTQGTVTVASLSNSLTHPVAVTVDKATNTVRWSESMRTLDTYRAAVCPTCPPIRRGAVLSQIVAFTSARFEPPFIGITTTFDSATTTRTYRMGDR